MAGNGSTDDRYPLFPLLNVLVWSLGVDVILMGLGFASLHQIKFDLEAQIKRGLCVALFHRTARPYSVAIV